MARRCKNWSKDSWRLDILENIVREPFQLCQESSARILGSPQDHNDAFLQARKRLRNFVVLSIGSSAGKKTKSPPTSMEIIAERETEEEIEEEEEAKEDQEAHATRNPNR